VAIAELSASVPAPLPGGPIADFNPRTIAMSGKLYHDGNSKWSSGRYLQPDDRGAESASGLIHTALITVKVTRGILHDNR